MLKLVLGGMGILEFYLGIAPDWYIRDLGGGGRRLEWLAGLPDEFSL